MVEKGFNSDIVYRGLSFHVQSEDWGFQNPFLVSRVFQNGAVVKSIKTPYSEVLGPSSGYGMLNRLSHDPQSIRLALRDQHERILDLLLGGKLF